MTSSRRDRATSLFDLSFRSSEWSDRAGSVARRSHKLARATTETKREGYTVGLIAFEIQTDRARRLFSLMQVSWWQKQRHESTYKRTCRHWRPVVRTETRNMNDFTYISDSQGNSTDTTRPVCKRLRGPTHPNPDMPAAQGARGCQIWSWHNYTPSNLGQMSVIQFVTIEIYLFIYFFTFRVNVCTGKIYFTIAVKLRELLIYTQYCEWQPWHVHFF